MIAKVQVDDRRADLAAAKARCPGRRRISKRRGRALIITPPTPVTPPPTGGPQPQSKKFSEPDSWLPGFYHTMAPMLEI